MGLANTHMKTTKGHSCVYVKSRRTTLTRFVLFRSFYFIVVSTDWTNNHKCASYAMAYFIPHIVKKKVDLNDLN